MPRRVSLPGADELFRTTGGATLTSRQAADAAGTADTAAPGTGSGASAAAAGTTAGAGSESNGRGTVPAPSSGPDAESAPAASQNTPARDQEPPAAPAGGPSAPEQRVAPAVVPAPSREPGSAPPPAAPAPRAAPRRGRAPRRPSGRERHDEKITVYVSAEELMDLEHARLTLRGDFGLAVDRGRIVREAIAVVLADLEARGETSILVRRLRGGPGPGH
ncbi:hypothetical protein LO772_25790 [Yinghuangia sp. ASG 101]|uniref:hypothetical protein n=1 Tax=Yinghuangia sp. ASG 101 TaxID=2896848 RepID=UPI001E493DD5|nr:hypothetical protein [Yinghuangia sp. ASG 101]UGQ10257.1 hypothetical protein LO772_25790 [Yinghuangia sp. ASG 101]